MCRYDTLKALGIDVNIVKKLKFGKSKLYLMIAYNNEYYFIYVGVEKGEVNTISIGRPDEHCTETWKGSPAGWKMVQEIIFKSEH